jgi:hypothetical protein
MAAFELGRGTKTATAVSGAATLHQLSGVVTSESLSTAAGSRAMSLTITDNTVAANDQVSCQRFRRHQLAPESPASDESGARGRVAAWSLISNFACDLGPKWHASCNSSSVFKN